MKEKFFNGKLEKTVIDRVALLIKKNELDGRIALLINERKKIKQKLEKIDNAFISLVPGN